MPSDSWPSAVEEGGKGNGRRERRSQRPKREWKVDLAKVGIDLPVKAPTERSREFPLTHEGQALEEKERATGQRRSSREVGESKGKHGEEDSLGDDSGDGSSGGDSLDVDVLSTLVEVIEKR